MDHQKIPFVLGLVQAHLAKVCFGSAQSQTEMVWVMLDDVSERSFVTRPRLSTPKCRESKTEKLKVANCGVSD